MHMHTQRFKSYLTVFLFTVGKNIICVCGLTWTYNEKKMCLKFTYRNTEPKSSEALPIGNKKYSKISGDFVYKINLYSK